MRTATIDVSFRDKEYHRAFPIKDKIQEYEIADYAFQVTLMFVQNCVTAERGYKPSDSELGRLLEEVDYSYTIKGE